jgi:hypothetical protein
MRCSKCATENPPGRDSAADAGLRSPSDAHDAVQRTRPRSDSAAIAELRYPTELRLQTMKALSLRRLAFT